jgi:putative ATPase
MVNLGYGKNYQYAHNGKNNFLEQEFFPEDLNGQKIYYPGRNPKEKKASDWLDKLWKGKY